MQTQDGTHQGASGRKLLEDTVVVMVCPLTPSRRMSRWVLF